MLTSSSSPNVLNTINTASLTHDKKPLIGTLEKLPEKSHIRIKPILATALFAYREAVLNPYALIFTISLPLAMYFMFGVGQPYSQVNLGHGNIQARILLNMTIYGTLVFNANVGVLLVFDRTKGWLRQIALTPLGIPGYLIGRAIACVGGTMTFTLICFATGAATGARMEPLVWVQTFFLAVAVSLLAMTFGFAAAFTGGTRSAHTVVGTGSSILAFASGMFIPLESMGKFFQTVGPYMPYYGLHTVPQAALKGFSASITTWDIASVICWCTIFCVIATLTSRKVASSR